MIERKILLACYNMTLNSWNSMTARYSDSRVHRQGRVIEFSGTEEDFDDLLDRLYSNESNQKVIGIYEN